MSSFTAPQPVGRAAAVDALFERATIAGGQAVSEQMQGQVDTLKQRLVAETDLKKKQLDLEAQKEKDKLARVRKVNDEGYANIRADLMDGVKRQEGKLESQAINEESRAEAEQERSRLIGLVQRVDGIRSKLELEAPDQVQSYPAEARNRGMVKAPALKTEFEQAESGKRKSAYYTGEAAQRDVLTPGWDKTSRTGSGAGAGAGADGEVPLGAKAADDRADFSSAAIMLPQAKIALRDARERVDRGEGSIADEEAYKMAFANVQNLTKQYVAGYSDIVSRIETTEAPDVRAALQSIQTRLPQGIRANDINSHGYIREQVMAALAPLAKKVAQGQGLSADEIKTRDSYAKLSKYLRIDEPLEDLLKPDFSNVQAGSSKPGGAQ